tara:strand:+ start:1625 stop:2494 length:870 start_codon:yes stop_codon:yes gene_type:complete
MNTDLFIISGRSGSGKTTALKTLEDNGYKCLDNFPVNLLDMLIEKNLKKSGSTSNAYAVCADSRSESIELLPEVLNAWGRQGVNVILVYLDAQSPTLVKRFSETRRKHPLTSEEIDLREAVNLEAKYLERIAELADLTIDTTSLTSRDLEAQVLEFVISNKESSPINLVFRSFGFKRGVPIDADFVFDVRCLCNPRWIKGLEALTGLDDETREYLDSVPMVDDLYNDIKQFLSKWIPECEKNSKIYLTLAIGCTGGQHRSVYMAERLAQFFRTSYAIVQVRHRELKDFL